MRLGAPAKVSRGRAVKIRRASVKTSGLQVRPKAPRTKFALIPVISVMLVASLALLAIRPPATSNDNASRAPRAETQPVKNEAEAPAKPTNKAEDYFSDMLSKSNTGGFDFTSSDLDLSANSDFSKELQSSYGTSGFCNYGCHVYDSNGNYVTITCYGTTNSCTTYGSNGDTINTYCSSYINSCHSYSSSGDSYNTTCSNYTNSCNTTGSDGSYSNTYCSQYTSSCNTYDSGGGYSNTYCSQYTSSCNTYNSDGSSSTTYCSRYTSTCNTY